MKGYTVFNVEGLPAHYYAKTEAPLDPVQRIAHAESFFAAIRADIRLSLARRKGIEKFGGELTQ
jgi:antirestriction protein ArdC